MQKQNAKGTLAIGKTQTHSDGLYRAEKIFNTMIIHRLN